MSPPPINRFLLTGFLTAMLALAGAFGAIAAFPAYQIDFEQPASIPRNGPFISSSAALSMINFGNIGIGAFPGTGSNAAVFNTTGNPGPSFFYDQAALSFQRTGLLHYLSVDLYLTSILGTTNNFVILFDTPEVQPIVFNPDGSVSRSAYGLPIGYFEENKLLHLEAIGDTVNQVLSVTLNGVPLASSPYSADHGRLSTIRFSLGAITSLDANAPGTSVYVDNLFASVPEPSAVLLTLTALTILSTRRQRP
jgi:hypothetical protein